MAQEIIRRCDFKVGGKGKQDETCGVILKNEEGDSFEFVIRKQTYSVDLCKKHQDAFDAAVAPFQGSGPVRAIGAKGNVRSILKGKHGQTFTSKDVRAWLTDQGRDISPTGRVPLVLIEEYKEALGLS